MDEIDRDYQVNAFTTLGNTFAYAYYTESETKL